MDTKTPPIPLKCQEPKTAPRKQVADVSLPPLATCPNNRQKQRNAGTTWSRDATCSLRHQEHQRKRPYRVLHIGATPLMHACQQADRARVLRLLKEQEDTIGYRDRTLRNALHYCMDAGTGGAVAAAAPELVNAPDAEGHTPLHLAVIAGDTQLVAVLLANGADVNAKDLEGHSVLHWATVCGEAECVRLVLAAGARPSTPDLRGGSPLHYAAQCCGAAATAELAVPKKVGLKVLQTLLEFGADVNAKDEDGRQPILWAASAGSVEAVLALARAGGSAAAGASDKDGLTALHCAASRGHARCIEALVNLCGSNPDHVDDNGCSALHYAATLGHADATALILKLGADPNRQDRKGRTPALCAAAKGQLETLKILAQHGGSLHARTVRGTGVAHEAVASGRIELIKWLAKKRPSTLDVATQDGKTPLHVAALHGHLDACKVLLDHGARINAVLRTSKGSLMTPLDAALYRGHRDCAKLIQMHGGTTAQQLRTQKTAPSKAFTAKLRMKHTESSTETESSPRRRSRGHKYPDLYYEEQWIERRTRRRGNLGKLGRRDSRSFSEEEIRLSKTSSKKDRKERRARSESARYDDGDSIERRLRRRRRSRKRSSKLRHGFSESSESDSYGYSQDDLEENGISKTILRQKAEKRRSKEEREKSTNGSEKEEQQEEEENGSVSDDSLEVVVVKKSLEKKCEKVISGRGSKTPRESSKETKLTRTRKRSLRRRSRSSRSRTSENEEASEKIESAEKEKESKEEKQEAEAEQETPRTSVEDERRGSIVENRYRRDVTDSTSQETVERVIVTAMVHKDQAPDTPKSTMETSKEVTFEDTLREEKVEKEEIQKTVREESDEKAGEVKKATKDEIEADSKKGEEMKQQVGQKQIGVKSAEDVDQILPAETETSEDTATGRLDARESKESKSPADSQEPTVHEEQIQTRTKSEGSEESTSKDQEDFKENVTPRTVIETLPVSEDNKSADKGSKSEEKRTKRSVSRESSGKRTKQDSSKKRGTPKATKAEDSAKSGKEETEDTKGHSSSEPSAEEKEASQKDTLSLPEKTGKESAEDKDQADSARGKSVDLSSDSKDSMLAEEESEGSIKIEEEKETSPRKSDVDDLKRNEESKKIEEHFERQSTLEEGKEGFPCESSSGSPRPRSKRHSRPSTGKARRSRRGSRSPGKRNLFESSEDRSPERSAIIAVIESPEWDEEDEDVEKEIRDAIGENGEHDTEPEEDNEAGVVRVLPSTSEEETPRTGVGASRTSGIDSLPQVQPPCRVRSMRIQSPRDKHLRVKQRRDSGGRDSGIEPSPRISRIPRRRGTKCYPNTEKQHTLNMETITRDVQISLRRYHLERKIFFQLMELKRLQIRHGRANEHVLVKRQVDTFHKAGMSGPTLGVAKYDQPLTFRHFEAFLYEQLRKLQKRPATPDFCTDAKQCTQKTHRCHHATSAYTSGPVYTYLGGSASEREKTDLPKIESRGRGQMTVEVTHGEEKQIIALPAERLDRTKRYFVTFTVRGETQDTEKPKSSGCGQRNAKSV